MSVVLNAATLGQSPTSTVCSQLWPLLAMAVLVNSDVRSTLHPMYNEGCPHRIAYKNNCDLRPEWVTIFVSTQQRCTFSSRGNIYAVWCVPKENNCDVIRQDVIRYSHADWLKRFSGGLTFCDLRLAISKIQQENFQNIARLWLIRFARPSTPALHRSQGPYMSNVSKYIPIYVLAMYGVDRALYWHTPYVTRPGNVVATAAGHAFSTRRKSPTLTRWGEGPEMGNNNALCDVRTKWHGSWRVWKSAQAQTIEWKPTWVGWATCRWPVGLIDGSPRVRVFTLFPLDTRYRSIFGPSQCVVYTNEYWQIGSSGTFGLVKHRGLHERWRDWRRYLDSEEWAGLPEGPVPVYKCRLFGVSKHLIHCLTNSSSQRIQSVYLGRKYACEWTVHS